MWSSVDMRIDGSAQGCNCWLEVGLASHGMNVLT